LFDQPGIGSAHHRAEYGVQRERRERQQDAVVEAERAEARKRHEAHHHHEPEHASEEDAALAQVVARQIGIEPSEQRAPGGAKDEVKGPAARDADSEQLAEQLREAELRHEAVLDVDLQQRGDHRSRKQAGHCSLVEIRHDSTPPRNSTTIGAQRSSFRYGIGALLAES
jgi:hypothetical protein